MIQKVPKIAKFRVVAHLENLEKSGNFVVVGGQQPC